VMGTEKHDGLQLLPTCKKKKRGVGIQYNFRTTLERQGGGGGQRTRFGLYINRQQGKREIGVGKNVEVPPKSRPNGTTGFAKKSSHDDLEHIAITKR